jgi:2-amino-4-hydroxy-6-hydroxymethyldihydropteridine diphosphokinase
VTVAYIGIGSNLDDPVRHIRSALAELEQLPHTRLVRQSSLYRSSPIGYAAQPEFVNAVAQLETGLPAGRLLAELQEIEARHGRSRSFANAPRTLDLDVLLYGDAILDTAALKIPHPRMHERAFVLQPLTEIAPDIEIPRRGSAKVCLQACSGQEVRKIDG